jgi:hypothetical protein
MRRKIWGVIVLGLLALLALGIFLTPKLRKNKRFDRTIQYTPKTFKPYDTRFFYESLQKYAGKGFKKNRTAPGPKTLTGENTIYVICSPNFLPDETEKREIFKFVAAGNDLILSTFSVSDNALDGLSDILYIDSKLRKPFWGVHDSLSIKWHNGQKYSYPGSAASTPIYLDEFEENNAPEILSTDEKDNWPSLVAFKYGKGKIYIQLQPTVFSNYFLLHKDNSALLSNLFQDLDIKNKRVIWDDFYINLKDASQRRSNNNQSPKGESFFLKMLKEHPPLQWAVITFLIALILFVINHSRRVRQPIEKLPDVQNTSLEFTNAIAELYWQRKDHNSIAHKIQLQLQSYLFSNYKIFAKDLNENNTEFIATKTGKSQEEITQLLKSIQEVKTTDISDQKLIEFYRLVYKFIYK